MILALDPGLATCGWAIVRPRTGRVVDLGVITSKPDEDLGKHADRVKRARDQARILFAAIEQHDVTMIAAEELSIKGRTGFNMIAAVHLSWGVITALSLGVRHGFCAIPPKTWQRAILPGTGAIDYDEVFRRLHAFTVDQTDKLVSIAPSRRNHALDAIGVGIFAALRVETARAA